MDDMGPGHPELVHVIAPYGALVHSGKQLWLFLIQLLLIPGSSSPARRLGEKSSSANRLPYFAGQFLTPTYQAIHYEVAKVGRKPDERGVTV